MKLTHKDMRVEGNSDGKKNDISSNRRGQEREMRVDVIKTYHVNV